MLRRKGGAFLTGAGNGAGIVLRIQHTLPCNPHLTRTGTPINGAWQ